MSKANYKFFIPHHFGVQNQMEHFALSLRPSRLNMKYETSSRGRQSGVGCKLFLSSLALAKKN